MKKLNVMKIKGIFFNLKIFGKVSHMKYKVIDFAAVTNQLW